MASTSTNRPSDQEIIQKFNFMKQEMASIAQKIGELEQEKEEHQMVYDTIKDLSSDRTCYRLIGGILVEKTVGEVAPMVAQNQQGIQNLMQQLGVTYKKKEEEMNAFQQKYNIKIKK